MILTNSIIMLLNILNEIIIQVLIFIIFASIFGTFIPMVLNQMKIDPALATGPFITTSNDLLGIVIYFSIGRLLY